MKIENHSRLADSEIEVRQHLILVGPNDVGKSSLLRCLDFLLGASNAQLYNRITAEDFADPALPFVVEADLAGLSADHHALFPDEATVDPITSVITLTVRLAVVVDANGTLGIDRLAPHSGTNRQLSRAQMDALGWTLLGATAMARDLRDDRRTALDEILQRVDLGAEKAGFDALVEQVQKGLKNSKILEGLRDDLAGQLSKALPIAIDKGALEFVTAATADGDVLADVRLHVERGGSFKNITDQSDGLRALYALALYDLFSVGANMVAVDEPEIHLHPTSQRSLASLLRDGPNQKLLATHSPDIVSAFSPDSIVAVRAGGTLVQPKAGFLSADEKMVVHWWVRDKLEPLTASHVVAVEGVSDRIIVQVVADLTDRNLDRLGVSIVETDGAGDMGAIIKLFGADGFEVDMTMLVDEDARNDTANKLGVAAADLESNGHFVSGPDLEAEYIAAIGALDTWVAFGTSGLFTKNQLANCVMTGPGGTPTPDDIRTFVIKYRHKVRAAMAAAKVLDDATARKITSVNATLTKVAGK
ncbi:ATP-dependent endonuclease [Phycicoccus sp. Root101]|uniref:ATP-dependent nuclease n=1 Tax=Phycicoccus sp. Root101 TaxID=1736421 RepID=UPI0019102FC6|nr:ATP-binding protein [Phycicoccus sp. Root101]